MAEKGIQIKVNSKQLNKQLAILRKRNLRAAKSISNSSEPLDKIRFIAFRDIMKHFKDERGQKRRWKGLKKSTIARRRTGKNKSRGHKILQDSGRLRLSITHRRDGQSVKIGTNLIYAKTHDEGFKRRNIPQREFLWLSKPVKKKIVNEFLSSIRKAYK